MRGVRASHIDQGRHSRFPARVLQRPGSDQAKTVRGKHIVKLPQ